MVASALLRNTVSISTKEWQAGNYFREIKKHCALKKKLLPAINYSNLGRKNVL